MADPGDYYRGQFRAAEITEPVGWRGSSTRTAIHVVNLHGAVVCDLNTLRRGVSVRNLDGNPKDLATCGRCASWAHQNL